MDNIMNAGRFGVFDIIKESFKTWRMDVDGTLPEHIRSRGVRLWGFQKMLVTLSRICE